MVVQPGCTFVEQNTEQLLYQLGFHPNLEFVFIQRAAQRFNRMTENALGQVGQKEGRILLTWQNTALGYHLKSNTRFLFLQL